MYVCMYIYIYMYTYIERERHLIIVYNDSRGLRSHGFLGAPYSGAPSL